MKAVVFKALTLLLALFIALPSLSSCETSEGDSQDIKIQKDDLRILITYPELYGYTDLLKTEGIALNEDEITAIYENFYEYDSPEDHELDNYRAIDLRGVLPEAQDLFEQLYEQENGSEIDLSEYRVKSAAQNVNGIHITWQKIVNGLVVHKVRAVFSYELEVLSASSSAIFDFDKAEAIASIDKEELESVIFAMFDEIFAPLTESGYTLGKKRLDASPYNSYDMKAFSHTSIAYNKTTESYAAVYTVSFTVTSPDPKKKSATSFTALVFIPIE